MGSRLCTLAAAAGAAVAVAARSVGFVQELTEQITAAGHRAIGVPTDLRDPAQCQHLADATVQAFGRIDGLVNSARARGTPQRLEESDLSSWPPIMDVTCFGALRMAQAVLPVMKRQREGAIVNIGAISTVRPVPGEGAYSVAKSAMGGLTRQMAAEFAPYNI